MVSSFSQAVEIGPKPVIIGERINPTGKSKFKAALRENNIEYILGEGMAQEDSGAHILDVNVGLPEIDEPVMMERVVTRLQSVIALPLQIDTSDTTAMERGTRLYNGKPMINSVSGKMESMEAVFPLVRKYGGVVVGLALDENGIPSTAEGRIRIAKKIYDTAEKYGIPHEDIVIDGLAMTISSDSGSPCNAPKRCAAFVMSCTVTRFSAYRTFRSVCRSVRLSTRTSSRWRCRAVCPARSSTRITRR